MAEMSAGMNDIGTNVMRMVNTFERYSMKVAIIELSSWAEGESFRRMLLADPVYSRTHQVVMDDKGMSKNEMEMCGIKIRWPTFRPAVVHNGYMFF